VNGLFRSELRKIFTTRLWWGLLIGLVVSWGALAGLLGGLSGSRAGGQSTPGLDDPATIRSIYTAGLTIAYLITLAFGVISMAGEYRQQTITATLLASPRRTRVILAKLGAVSLVGLGYGLVGVLSGLIVGVPVISIRGGHLDLTTNGVPRALLTAAVAVALWAVVGLGVGTLIRNQIVALLVAIGVAWIAEPLIALILNASGAGSVARFLPGQATSALVSPATQNGGVNIDLLPWWGGALVLIGYAVLSGGLGAAITLRRDIS
jgi:ABC-2 type transport system permease protein